MDMSNPAEREQLVKMNTDLKAPRISEIVLKTMQYEAMKAWYSGVFGLAPFYENIPQTQARPKAGQMERATDTRLCFIRLHYDHPYAQVVAIFEIPGTRTAPSASMSSRSILAARSDRLDRNRSRVPVRRKVGGKLATSPNNGDTRGSPRSASPA